MPQTVADFMTVPDISVHTRDTVEAVEQLLETKGLSAVPVLDEQGVIYGIVSTMDIVLFHHKTKNAKTILARELCPHKPFQIPAATPIDEAVQQMVRKHLYHLSVIDAQGKIVGYLSALDLLARAYPQATQ